LIVSIGHELQHAVEALSNPNIKTSSALFFFFYLAGRPDGPRRFETEAATHVGLAVAKEACRETDQ
jgi:hypothetical protein